MLSELFVEFGYSGSSVARCGAQAGTESHFNATDTVDAAVCSIRIGIETAVTGVKTVARG